MGPMTMRNMVSEGLGMESPVVVQRLLLTPNAQEMKKERCQKLLNKLKASQPHQVHIFVNEKIFTKDVPVNRHNSHYLTDLPMANMDPIICISSKSTALLKQMVLGMVGSNGQKCLIVLVGAGE